MTYRIEILDAHTAPDSVLQMAHQAFVDREADLHPDGPETPYEHRLLMWRAQSGYWTSTRFAAFDNDDLAGVMLAVIWRDQPEVGLVTPAVRTAWRGKGVAKALAVPALEHLASETRSKVIVDLPSGSSIEPVVARYGLKKALDEKVNRLRVSEVDWELMAHWEASISERAPEYELLFLKTPFPEEYLDRWCQISDVMNTMPMEDLDLELPKMTAEKWRAVEQGYASQRAEYRACIAVHKTTGDFAGMTTIWAQSLFPELAVQDDTAVAPSHRGQNLGRIIKAAMLRRFIEEFPAVEVIETGNAGSNAPMLKINTEMGYRTVLEMSAWQGEIPTVLDRLG